MQLSHPVHLSSTSGLTIEPKVLICRILSSVFTEPGRRSELQAEETQIGNFPVAIAWGPHLFPFRTQKLSPTAPMVLPWRRGGRVGRCRRTLKAHRFENIGRWASLIQECLLGCRSRKHTVGYFPQVLCFRFTASCDDRVHISFMKSTALLLHDHTKVAGIHERTWGS